MSDPIAAALSQLCLDDINGHLYQCDMCSAPSHEVKGGAVIIENDESDDKVPSNVCADCMRTMVDVSDVARETYIRTARETLARCGRGLLNGALKRPFLRAMSYGVTVVKGGAYKERYNMNANELLIEGIARWEARHGGVPRMCYVPPININGEFTPSLSHMLQQKADTHFVRNYNSESGNSVLYICSQCHRRSLSEMIFCPDCQQTVYCDDECCKRNRPLHAQQCVPYVATLRDERNKLSKN